MTITIELPQDTLEALQAEAQAQGRAVEEWAAERLTALYPAMATRPKTGAELVQYWQENGLLGGYGDPAMDSPELAWRLRRQAETRQW